MFGFGALVHAYRVVQATRHETAKARVRSPHWPAVEHAHIKLHPKCAACDGIVRVQVHHKQPFHLHPELELDPKNLISLCMGPFDCHLLIGHGGNFKCWNPDVVSHAAVALSTPALRNAVVKDARGGRKL